MIYLIDACALIDAAKNYNISKKSFAFFWDRLAEMAQNNKLISSVEVRDELLDDDLIEWAKKYSKIFYPIDEAVQKKTIEILAKFPGMIKLTSTKNSNADPFLVATASLTEDCTVVTNERKSDAINIPFVCNKLKIRCITLKEFIDEIIE